MFRSSFLAIVNAVLLLSYFAVIGSGFGDLGKDVVVRPLDLFGIPGPYRFESVCANSKRGFWSLAGEGEVHFLDDVSHQWKVSKLADESRYNGGLYGAFCGEGSVIVVGDSGVIFQTVDDQKTWHFRKSNVSNRIRLESVTCVDNSCWAVGGYGTAISSRDRGVTWSNVDLKADEEDLVAVEFIDKENGFVAGGNGTIWKTIDGGKTWSNSILKIDGERAHSLSIKFLDRKRGWISGFDFVSRTTDGGETWQTSELEGQIIGIITHNGNKVWAIKYGGNYCSVDAGKSWRECCVDMK